MSIGTKKVVVNPGKYDIVSLPGGKVVVSITGIVISEKGEASDEVAMVTEPSPVVGVVTVVIACDVVS